MKKVLFGLGVLAVLSFPLIGCAYSESNDGYYYPLNYVYPSDDWQVMDELTYGSELYTIKNGEEEKVDLADKTRPNRFTVAGVKPSDPWFKSHNGPSFQDSFDNNYPLSTKKMNEAHGGLSAEWDLNNIDFVKYFNNIEYLSLDGNFVDLRPIENAKNLESLSLWCSASSFSFLENLNNLKSLYLSLTNRTETGYDDTIKVLTDITFVNNLEILKDINIDSSQRPFPTISLKKSMNKYVLVNPFILSKQFKNPEIKITSKTPGFTFEDDILTWDGITLETKELQISWEFTSNENGSFKFSGDSVIPINWID